jgi:hypothetical protein
LRSKTAGLSVSPSTTEILLSLPRPRRLAALLAAIGLAALGLTQIPQASAAPPADQTIVLPVGAGTNTIHYSGHAPFNNDQDGLIYGQLGLDDPTNPCSPTNNTLNHQHHVALKVPVKPNPALDVLVTFQIDWVTTNEPLEDMALYLYGPDGHLVDSSDGSQTQENINLTEAKPGVYDVLVCSFQNGPAGTDYTGTVTARLVNPGATPNAKSVVSPTYHQFLAPKDESTFAGEPSIGNNWKSGHTLFTSNTEEYDVAFNDAKKTATWNKVNTLPNASNTLSFDPIGFTDAVTGRTFVSQLFLVCSGAVHTDNDFKSVSNPSQGCGSGINGFDHQTIGGGPYPAGKSGSGSYPHAVYYCAQAQGLLLGDATCSRSDDGGTIFGTPHTVWHTQCSGLHGHVRVAPDGTVYLPNDNCHGKHGLGISRDAGVTWTVSTIPDSVAGQSDPSVATGSDGTVYYGYSDGTGRPKLAISRDHGAHWSKSVNLGAGVGVRNSEFAEVIAGDGARAAFAFLGTKTPGPTQRDNFGMSTDGKKFVGADWYLYVATTYDRGATWTTVNATPGDPVQRGCIWNGGGSNDCRNLLDFNDITVDKIGRVMVGYADGCVAKAIDADSNCIASTLVSANGYTDHGAIARQMSGKGLFKQYDGILPGSGGVTATPRKSNGSLATTGMTPYVAGFGVLLMLVSAGVWRRRRHTHA